MDDSEPTDDEILPDDEHQPAGPLPITLLEVIRPIIKGIPDAETIENFHRLKRDPSILAYWTREQCHPLVVWFCTSPLVEDSQEPIEDLPVLHCLLTSGKMAIDDYLRVPSYEGVETALSLAVLADNIPLIKYFLKMGASPDVLVGFESIPQQRPGSLAFDRIRGAPEEYYGMLLQYSPRPIRSAFGEDALRSDMDRSEFVSYVHEHDMVAGFSTGIEFDLAELRTNPKILEDWSLLHIAYVYSRLIKRRPNGPVPNDYAMLDLLFASGKVTVNDNLLGCGYERITALYEAVSSRNTNFVRDLLQKYKADPNQRCYVDGMPWNDMTHIVFPLGVALRAFMVWDDGEADCIRSIVDLLLDTGTRQDVQVQTIEAILQQDMITLMDCKEASHFLRMVQRLISRAPHIVAQIHPPLTCSMPLLLSSCEQKWMKINMDALSHQSFRVEIVVQMAVPLIESALRAGAPYPPQEILMSLATTRCHLTLASLVYALGDKLPLHHADVDRIRFLNPYTEEHAEAGLLPHDIYTRDAVRVTALINILVKSTAASLQWIPLLRYLHAFMLVPRVKFPDNYFSLKNLCMGVINDMIRKNGVRMKDYVESILPVTVLHELKMEHEFDLLNNVVF